jgi:hypothetical protein
MKKEVLNKIHHLAAKAKELKDVDLAKPNINTINSLAENIKSKEQADAFKKMLKAL